ncbi:uncharacterized protein PV06_09817 [Exophiala oligosperma]|uniref:ORC6 first cyclin-like domain-containing protein n=1 Tax=Exophiala oligosperma TaxID=215243 RepID=A0A0D2BKA0_9EURO|nr:uncharacterized protein PV06_09817 [Exophiala oligosperma]KIW37832.1 hypothetical protein PV06_09817 [Exophiala oligosperma]
MAPSAITQSLAALLPTYANNFPPQLTHLAESLLAQSHQRASHLKPEEEIARAYACSEIACKRLRAQCRLPAAKSSSAPCKPTVYKKLVTFLQRVLDEESALQQQTPKSTPGGGRKRTADGQFKNNKINPAAAVGSSEPSTPSKTKTGRNNNNTPNGGFVGKIKASSAGKSRSSENNEAPSWLMPSIRKLCRLFSTPLLAPHVYTGTCVILRLAGMWPRPEDAADNLEDEEEFKQNVTGLMVALYLMTLTRMKTGKMTTTVYKSTCSRAVAEIEYAAGTEGVEAWIRRINREGYCGQQDWWVSVPEAVFAFDPSKTACMVDDDDDDDKEDAIEDDDVLVSRQRRWRPGRSAAAADDEDDEDEEDPNGVLLPGLHTMMQDAVDFLSEERTREYEAWKKALLRKLDRLDKVPAGKEARALAVH